MAMSWTHRDRVLAALNHEEADRVAIDFGSTGATTATLPAYQRLKEYLGLEHETVVMSEIFQTAAPDDSVVKRFEVDARCLAFGVDAPKVRENAYRDDWGVIWQRAPDRHAMPVDGPFYGKEPDIEALESFEPPNADNPEYFRGLRERAQAARATGCAIVLRTPPACASQGQVIRGFGDWLKDLYKHREFSLRMMDMANDWWIRIVRNALEAMGHDVDVVWVNDDLGSQQGPLFNPELYRELIKPRHRQAIEEIKAAAGVKILFHSCGAVSEFVDDLIEIGVDALNPVQVNAAGMEPERLKQEFGARIAFWGGIDTQRLLPYGSADEVAAETRRIANLLGKGGGLVLGSVHNVQVEVPPENVVAMFDTALAHRYRNTA